VVTLVTQRARCGETTIIVQATRRPKNSPAGWIKVKRSTPGGYRWGWIRERDLLENAGSERPCGRKEDACSHG